MSAGPDETPPRPNPSPSRPKYRYGDLSPEKPSGVFHPVTGKQRGAFVAGSVAGGTLAAVAGVVIQLASMWREDRREEREAARMEREAIRASEEHREMRELRWRVVQESKQPWAAAPPVDGGPK